jgi:hypothetical protein
MELFNKIGYPAPAQYRFLQLITSLEPNVFHYAEKRQILKKSKTFLTRSQLYKVLDEKAPDAK